MLKDAPVVSYDPTRKLTIADLADTMVRLQQQEDARRKSGWKPEYILSPAEAEVAELSYLTWLGENYRVLVSSEVHKIVTERFAEKK